MNASAFLMLMAIRRPLHPLSLKGALTPVPATALDPTGVGKAPVASPQNSFFVDQDPQLGTPTRVASPFFRPGSQATRLSPRPSEHFVPILEVCARIQSSGNFPADWSRLFSKTLSGFPRELFRILEESPEVEGSLKFFEQEGLSGDIVSLQLLDSLKAFEKSPQAYFDQCRSRSKDYALRSLYEETGSKGPRGKNWPEDFIDQDLTDRLQSTLREILDNDGRETTEAFCESRRLSLGILFRRIRHIIQKLEEYREISAHPFAFLQMAKSLAAQRISRIADLHREITEARNGDRKWPQDFAAKLQPPLRDLFFAVLLSRGIEVDAVISGEIDRSTDAIRQRTLLLIGKLETYRKSLSADPAAPQTDVCANHSSRGAAVRRIREELSAEPSANPQWEEEFLDTLPDVQREIFGAVVLNRDLKSNGQLAKELGFKKDYFAVNLGYLLADLREYNASPQAYLKRKMKCERLYAIRKLYRTMGQEPAIPLEWIWELWSDFKPEEKRVFAAAFHVDGSKNHRQIAEELEIPAASLPYLLASIVSKMGRLIAASRPVSDAELSSSEVLQEIGEEEKNARVRRLLENRRAEKILELCRDASAPWIRDFLETLKGRAAAMFRIILNLPVSDAEVHRAVLGMDRVFPRGPLDSLGRKLEDYRDAPKRYLEKYRSQDAVYAIRKLREEILLDENILPEWIRDFPETLGPVQRLAYESHTGPNSQTEDAEAEVGLRARTDFGRNNSLVLSKLLSFRKDPQRYLSLCDKRKVRLEKIKAWVRALSAEDFADRTSRLFPSHRAVLKFIFEGKSLEALARHLGLSLPVLHTYFHPIEQQLFDEKITRGGESMHNRRTPIYEKRLRRWIQALPPREREVFQSGLGVEEQYALEEVMAEADSINLIHLERSAELASRPFKFYLISLLKAAQAHSRNRGEAMRRAELLQSKQLSDPDFQRIKNLSEESLLVWQSFFDETLEYSVAREIAGSQDTPSIHRLANAHFVPPERIASICEKIVEKIDWISPNLRMKTAEQEWRQRLYDSIEDIED